MATCYFCGKDLQPGTGKLRVTKEDALRYYCSSKCENNDQIRDRKDVRWTVAYKQLKDRRLKTAAGKTEAPAQEKPAAKKK